MHRSITKVSRRGAKAPPEINTVYVRELVRWGCMTIHCTLFMCFSHYGYVIVSRRHDFSLFGENYYIKFAFQSGSNESRLVRVNGAVVYSHIARTVTYVIDMLSMCHLVKSTKDYFYWILSWSRCKWSYRVYFTFSTWIRAIWWMSSITTLTQGYIMSEKTRTLISLY